MEAKGVPLKKCYDERCQLKSLIIVQKREPVLGMDMGITIGVFLSCR
jgi:hypothetical protein